MITEGKTIVKILEGTYQGKEGRVQVMAKEVPKNVGVQLGGMLVWFTPKQVMILVP